MSAPRARRLTAYRIVAALLWGLAAYDSLVCRGLFWDGASFLVNIVDSGTFHDFYPARANVGYVTQLPVLLALKLGVANLRTLAIIQSAALFALPVGLYHYALARVRHDRLLLSIVMIEVAVVYLPTSFFIIGEYNALYAAATAAMATVLTVKHRRAYDGFLLGALGVLSVCSYEAMIYFGPLLVAAMLWWRQRLPAADRQTRALALVAALGFACGAIVSGATVVEYWNHPHFVLVRAAVFDFWQNQQFIVPVAGFAVFALLSLVWPAWLRTRAPATLIVVVAVVLVSTLKFRDWFNPEAMVFPPAQYVARTAAGCLLWALLVVAWTHTMWQSRPPTLLATLREESVGRRLVAAMVVLVMAAALPDVVLTRLWSGYIGYLRALVASGSAPIAAGAIPGGTWPYRLFFQDWSTPALTAIVRATPEQAIVLAVEGPGDMPPFDSRCGTLPRLRGYRWVE